ncbi:MAG: hypothetical protein R3Y11_09265, partial [Pseudomonadota bacterium]
MIEAVRRAILQSCIISLSCGDNVTERPVFIGNPPFFSPRGRKHHTKLALSSTNKKFRKGGGR